MHVRESPIIFFLCSFLPVLLRVKLIMDRAQQLQTEGTIAAWNSPCKSTFIKARLSYNESHLNKLFCEHVNIYKERNRNPVINLKNHQRKSSYCWGWAKQRWFHLRRLRGVWKPLQIPYRLCQPQGGWSSFTRSQWMPTNSLVNQKMRLFLFIFLFRSSSSACCSC